MTEVASYSQAARDGVQPGMRVVSLNDRQLIRLPELTYPAQDPNNPDQEPGAEPMWSSRASRHRSRCPRTSSSGCPGADRLRGSPSPRKRWRTGRRIRAACLGVYYPWSINESSLALLPGLAILFGACGCSAAGARGESLRCRSRSPRPCRALPRAAARGHALAPGDRDRRIPGRRRGAAARRCAGRPGRGSRPIADDLRLAIAASALVGRDDGEPRRHGPPWAGIDGLLCGVPRRRDPAHPGARRGGLPGPARTL